MSEEWTRSISWSKMNRYNTCPRQFKFKYVDEIEDEKSQAMTDGINMHDYMDEFYSLQGDEPNIDTAVTLAMELFDEGQRPRYRPWVENFYDWNLRLYEKFGEEHWKPLFTEEWVEVEIEGKVHHGYIDGIWWDPNREEYGVVDYKPNAKEGSRIKGQTAYYGSFLLEVADLLDQDVEWAGTFGYKDGNFKRWDIHWASKRATKRKIKALVELKDGYEAQFGFHCDWCPYMEECMMAEQEPNRDEGLLKT